jgi:hypothetical protein
MKVQEIMERPAQNTWSHEPLDTISSGSESGNFGRVEENTPIQDIKETFNLLKSGRMLYLMPLITWSAVSIAIFGGIFIPLMVRTMKNSVEIHPDLVDDTNKQNETALLAMTLLGAGEILGGTFIGVIRDKKGYKVALFMEMLL